MIKISLKFVPEGAIANKFSASQKILVTDF